MADEIKYSKPHSESWKAELGGREVGRMSLSPMGPFASPVRIDEGLRRKGVATELYRLAEEDIGRRLIPSPLGLSPEAISFWKRRFSGMPVGEAQQLLTESLEIAEREGVGKTARKNLSQLGVDFETIEPRPKDQPRLPPLLEGPPEEPGKKPSKGRVMRGIGSLMRGRNVFSLIQALREGYELLPEEYQVLDEALQYLKGTEFNPFGMDKPGIESFKELLGISPEDLGETIPLPGREPSQRTSSKDTSIKQIAAVFKKPEIFDLKEGSVNLDIGGGKFDLGTDYLRNERGVENLVFDKFNRSPEHNEEVLNRIRGTGGADSATAANILNVIEEPEARKRVIQQSYDYTREGGKVFFQVYEGSGTGVGRETTKGWQNNKKTSEYIPEIEGIFGEGNVQRKGNIIIAIKEGSSPITIPDLAVNKAAGGFIDKPLYDDQRMIG
jgi:hypothetical protein